MGLCSCDLRHTASALVCFNISVLALGIVYLAMDEYDDGIGAAQVAVGAGGLVTCLLGLVCGGRRKFFMLLGFLCSVAVGVCWFGIFAWLVDEMNRHWDERTNGWKTVYVLSAFFVCVAAIHHCVLAIAFLKECRDKDEKRDKDEETKGSKGSAADKEDPAKSSGAGTASKVAEA